MFFFDVLQKVTFGAERDFDLREGKQLSDMGYVGYFSEQSVFRAFGCRSHASMPT